MANGGIIGPTNTTSFGKNKVTAKTASTPTIATTQPGTRIINTLVVAGGGAGGNSADSGGAGGGGGAGGVLQTNCLSVVGCQVLGAATIGAGGSASSFNTCGSPTNPGSNSSLVIGCTTYTATGGGKGGGRTFGSPAAPFQGGPGGSGGGSAPQVPRCAGTGVCGQGFPGGTIGVNPAGNQALSGGGGATAAGGDGDISPGSVPTFVSGPGGAGLTISSTFAGAPVSAVGGGGGAGSNATPVPGDMVQGSTGGTGGGGAGGATSSASGTAGTANTGGGGGGAAARAEGCSSNPRTAGAGGSGIVMIKEVNKASGVWSMCEQREVLNAGTWPKFLFGLECAAVMVVGGGGAAPSAPSGGGGGAGGMIFAPGPVAIIACGESGTVPITIGAGGTGGSAPPRPAEPFAFAGTIGSNTTVTITGGTPLVGVGGGAGGTPDSFQTCNPNYVDVGGSGGGGVGEGNSPGGTNPGGCSTQAPSMPAPLQPFGFGNAGGNGTACSSSPDRQSGGGGGAGAAGSPSSSGSNGGSGKDVSPVFGSSPQPFYIANGSNAGASVGGIFAGGGAGRQCAARSPGGGGTGGPGGGGNATNNANGSGVANTGGGGGAGFGPAPFSPVPINAYPGGNGGSGYVLIRVPGPKVPSGFAVAPGTNTLTTQPCGAKVAAFTVSGTLTIS